MTLWHLVILLGLSLSLLLALAWLVAMRSGQSGWIDAVWSFAVGAGAVAAALVPLSGDEGLSERQWLVAGLAAVWALRLGGYIAGRTKGAGDDPRYAYLRDSWGAAFPARLFWFLQIQAAAALLLVLTVLLAARNPAPGLGALDWLGVVVFAVALGGAAVADRQLARFRADPGNRGKVCDRGLWRLSRHPNYFFEWLGWLAYLPIAIDAGGGYPWGYLAAIGPLFMYWLLVHVSGVPPLEAHMLRSRGAAFRDYQERVNVFWPAWPGSGTKNERQAS